MEDITVYRNSSYKMTYAHTDGTVALPLTGCTVYFTVKNEKWDSDMTDTTALVSKTVTSHTDASNGLTEWVLTDADLNINPGKYYYDVIVEENGKSLPPVLQGKFKVLPVTTNRNVGNE